MKDSYGFLISKIDNLEKITDGNIHYVYKDIHFLHKKKPNEKNLAVIFHGAYAGKNVIFRGYDFEGYDVLSFHDKLINIYGGPFSNEKKITLAWFQNSKKYPNLISVYTEIIGSIVKKYNNIVFQGTSGGCFSSLYYSSIFKQHCIIGNPQIYLEKYKHYQKLEKALELNGDKLIPNVNIHDHFKKYGYPKNILLYSNTLDLHHYNEHILPFVKKCKEDSNYVVDLRTFTLKPTNNRSAHELNIPKGKYKDAIKKYFTNLK